MTRADCRLLLLLAVLASTLSGQAAGEAIKDFLELKSVESERVRVDAEIEDVWCEADSILIARQFFPYHDSQATYLTKVKVLQDRNALFFLFVTDFRRDQPRTALSGVSETYTIYLDPLQSRVAGYYFTVTGSGARGDGLLLEDAGKLDDSWAGVWESRVRAAQDGQGNWLLVAEVKIPFKTIRFDRNRKTWGLMIKAYYQKPKETCYWILPNKEEGLKVSRFGSLKNVEATVEGHGLEIYPVGFVKNTYSRNDSSNLGKLIPWGGVDVARKREASTLNITLLPDFAEIEADPFTTSLGKYEIYYSERRPFFLEGKEIFEPCGLGGMGFYKPIQVFYSRRIGRILRDGSGDVPILSGAKYTEKMGRYELGLLSCLTDKKLGVSDSAWHSSWNVFRIKRYLFKNSEIGMLETYRRDLETDDWALGFDMDGVFRLGRNLCAGQIVCNQDTSGNLGYTGRSGGLLYFDEHTFSGFSGSYVNDHFDISPMGYASGSPGDKGLGLFAGYSRSPRKGAVSSYTVCSGFDQEKEEGEGDVGWDQSMSFEVSANLRRPCRSWLYFSPGYGQNYHGDLAYHNKWVNYNVSLELGKLNCTAGELYGYGWNYQRDFLAWHRESWGSLYVPLTDRISFNPFFTSWAEYDTTGAHLATTASSSIYLTYSFTPFMRLTLAPNSALTYASSELDLPRLRFALYYSWEIRPRSKFHVVLNQLHTQQNGNWETSERIYAVKIRWLFFF